MKKLFALAALVAASLSASAQKSGIEWGLKGGLNLSDIQVKSAESMGQKLSYHLGLTMDVPLSRKVYFMSGIEYTRKGAKAKSNVTDSGSGSLNAHYLQIPLHLGMKLPMKGDTKFVIHAGPYVACATSAQIEVKNEAVKAEIDMLELGAFKRFDAGIGGGIGMEFGDISVGLGVDVGLTEVDKSNVTVPDDTTTPIQITKVGMKNINGFLTFGVRF